MRDLTGLKVCFVAGTLGQGGAERQLYYMLSALCQAGAQPRVLCLTQGEFWEQNIRALGVPLTWVGQHHSRIRRLRRIIADLRQNPPDVLQSQHFYTNIYVTAAARRLGLREVGALRSDGISEVGANHAVLGRISLHAPRTIAANSRAGIENAVALGVRRTRLHFLPNVVDTARFCVAGRSHDGTVRLLTVGRMVQQKRLDRFIRMLASVRAHSRTAVRGILAGDGPQRAVLESQAASLSLSPGDLEFCGMKAQVAPLYRAADVMVLTSDWEGTPNVVLEAMASGLPVISTRVGGVADLIRHGETGYLVEPHDEPALVDAVLDLVENRATREAFGAQAREYVAQYHATPRLTFELHNLYDAVLEDCA